MPRRFYKKRYTKRKTYKGLIRGRVGTLHPWTKSFSKGFNSVWNVASKALKMANDVKRLINVEIKYLDGDIADGTPIGYLPTASTGLFLNGIGQGDASYQRNGMSIKAKSLGLSFDVQRNASNANPQCARWFILYTPKSEGAGPDLARVFTNATFETTKNREYPYDSIILASGRVQVDNVKAQRVHVKRFIPLNFHQRFSGTANQVSDVARGDLHFVIWCDQSANKPTIEHFQSRFTYIDN